MDKTMLHTKAEVTKSDDDGIVEAVIASTSVLDRQGEIIDQNGWELENFQKNPVILWGHNIREERPPIGRAEKVWVDGDRKKKLMFKAKFDLQDAFAAEIFRKIKDKFLNTVSVGFLPIEREDNVYTKSELLEISFVPVPANPQASIMLRSMQIEPVELENLYPENKEVDKEQVSKKAIPFKEFETMPDSAGWDGPGEVSKAEITDLKIICTWFDDEKPDVKTSYKLPHHQVQGHKVVWRGVASAMAVLLGAQGGVDIPDEDRKAVYNHLAKHYQQFQKEVPEFRLVENQVLKGLGNEIMALTNDHEDKYSVRLMKKLMILIKNQDKKVTDSRDQMRQIIGALKLIDNAVSKALK